MSSPTVSLGMRPGASSSRAASTPESDLASRRPVRVMTRVSYAKE